jgi:hypothetical protein
MRDKRRQSQSDIRHWISTQSTEGGENGADDVMAKGVETFRNKGVAVTRRVELAGKHTDHRSNKRNEALAAGKQGQRQTFDFAPRKGIHAHMRLITCNANVMNTRPRLELIS